ncbi:MAG: UDP-N-acetylmuramoyl-tripeptide--D-alanyl-D-alanine ligase [Putridiphycobacter sp.]
MKINELYKLYKSSSGICTDSRKIVEHSIFFALKGQNFNGNDYAFQALDAGCDYAIVDEGLVANDDRIIKVDSVLKTLQNLANFHRKKFDIPIIGITGSNGKTTTKELISAVLKEKFNVLVTQGNLNNHLGVPLTLLELNNEHEIAVIEMGANKPNDISELVEICEPNYGIITNIGTAHIEGFGSFEGVLKTKLELYDFINSIEGTIFINSDDTILVENKPSKVQIVSYGDENTNVNLAGKLENLSPYLEFSFKEDNYHSPKIKTNLVGAYNLNNFLAAACIGRYFSVANENIVQAFENYVPDNNRSQVTKTEKNTLIMDCYNANPTSMKSALESFLKIDDLNKFVILGDMLELGSISLSEHQKIVDFLDSNKISGVLIGKEFKQVKSNYSTYLTIGDFIADIEKFELTEKFILLKGSRGIRLEKAIDVL